MEEKDKLFFQRYSGLSNGEFIYQGERLRFTEEEANVKFV